MSDRVHAFTTATGMLAALRARRVSAVDLFDLHRRRIERHNSELNAIVEPDFESIKKTLDVNGKPVLEEIGLFCASVATLAGQPSTAFPAGRSRGGLPIGLQAIGPYLEDRTPIRFASLVGRELGGFVRPPRYEGD